jgi:hypothetical protein
VADPVYVPGFGYVDQKSAGTSGGKSKYASGRLPTPTPTATSPHAALGVSQSERFRNTQQSAVTAATSRRTERYDLTEPTGYRPPINYGLTADRQEQQISTLPLVYRIQDAGDLREASWGDPESRAIIQAAARVYYRDYSNYNDQWAEGWWQEDIMGAALNPGAAPPWQMLQGIFGGELKASGGDTPGGASQSSGGGGYGGGGGGGGGSVSLTNPTSARGLLMQTMQGVLGRNPTEQEYSQFVKALNQAEMGAPRTVGFEGDLAVQSGGVDPGMVAMEYVEGLEEFDSAEGQRAFDSFIRVLGA